MRKNKKNKKAQMNNLILIAISIVIFALVIGTGLVILVNFGNSVVTCSSGFETIAVTNETGFINSSGYTLSGSTAYGFKTPILVLLYNKTNGNPIVLANASVSSAGLVTNKSVLVWNNASITYTYIWDNTHTWSSTSQACLNASGGDSETGTGVAYDTITTNESYLSDNLVPWIPAVIALLIGLFFIGQLMGKKKNKY